MLKERGVSSYKFVTIQNIYKYKKMTYMRKLYFHTRKPKKIKINWIKFNSRKKEGDGRILTLSHLNILQMKGAL